MIAHSTKGLAGQGLRPTRPPLLAGCGVELAAPDAVEEARPLVHVVDEHPAGLVAGHAHQHPVDSGGTVRADECDLDRPVAVAGPLPGLRGHVDAERFGRWFRCHDDLSVRATRAPNPAPAPPRVRRVHGRLTTPQ